MSPPLNRRETDAPSLDARSAAYLRRLQQLQRINGLLLALSLVGIFGGVVVGLFWQTLGVIVMVSGFSVGLLLLIQSYVIYPRLKCPRCKRRFFLPEGHWHWLARINPAQQKCRHCGLSLGACR